MRICIPTLDDRGLEARTSDHFGSAPFFTLVDTESGDCDVIPNGGHGHGGGACAPVDRLAARGLDAVVCHGMGRGARANLQRAGVDVLLADGESVAEVVEAARRGGLQPLPADQACGGHHRGRMEGQQDVDGPGR